MKNSLRLKVTASVGVVLIIVFLALLVAETRLATNELSAKAHRSSQMVTLTVEKSLRDAMLTGRRGDVTAIISSVAELPDVHRITVMDSDGDAIYHTPGSKDDIGRSDVREMISLSARTGTPVSRDVGADIMRTISPIRNEKRCWSCHNAKQKYVGHLMMDVSTRADRLALSANRRTIVTWGVVGLTASVLTLLIMLSRLVYRPIDRLVLAMGKIKEGGMSARVDTSGGDELRRLSEALNIMVAGLERQNAEIVKSREHLLEAKRLATVGLLAAGIAHEINNPNGAILVAAEGLARHIPPNSDEGKLVGLIGRSSERISRLVSDLLRFDPEQPMSRQPVDINALAQDAVNAVVDGLAGPQHTVSLNLAADAQSIVGDAERLRQALVNVLTNAIEAMPSGGSLRVDTHSDDKNAHIVISDTGIGISKEDLPRVTDPFFTRKETGKGRGLGLAVAREIISQHGGDLCVGRPFCPTPTPNQGTTVEIRIPVGGQIDCPHKT